MSNTATIARPYAKAIFEHALAGKKLPEWSGILHQLAQIVLHPEVERFIRNPSTSADLHVDLLLSIYTKMLDQSLEKAAENVIRLLAQNKRLMLLPDICVQFDALRAEQEKTLRVQVSSFSPFTGEQKEKLIKILKERLQRDIALDINIEPSLLGGAVIRAGDYVIDGSVRGKLNILRSKLAA